MEPANKAAVEKSTPPSQNRAGAESGLNGEEQARSRANADPLQWRSSFRWRRQWSEKDAKLFTLHTVMPMGILLIALVLPPFSDSRNEIAGLMVAVLSMTWLVVKVLPMGFQASVGL